MFCQFIHKNYSIPHNNPQKLQHISILSKHRIILFFLHSYLIYDFKISQVVFQQRTPEVSYRSLIAQPIDQNQILMYRRKDCKISRLKVYTGDMVELSQTNPSQSADSLLVFAKSKLTYYMKRSEQSVNLYGYENKQALTLGAAACWMEKYNEVDRLVFFSQVSGSNSYTVIDCSNDTKTDHVLVSKQDISKYTLQFVRELDQDQVLVGWNRGWPTPACLWVYDLRRQQVVSEVPLRRVILGVVGVLPEEGIVALKRVGDGRDSLLEYIYFREKEEKVVCEVIWPQGSNLEATTKTVVVINDLDTQYITSVTRNQAIPKKTCYLHLMKKTGILEKYGSGIGNAVLNVLEQEEGHE